MEKWVQIPLGELGKTFAGLSGKTKDDFGEGLPYITYLNVFSNWKTDPTMVGFVRVLKGEKQNSVQYGDIFFTTSSETVDEVGMASVLLSPLSSTYLNSFCFGFRLYGFDELLPEFAPYLLRSDQVRHEISLKGQGSTRFNLSKKELLQKLVLSIPTKKEQQRIAEILSTVDAAIEQTQALIGKYHRIKRGLMQDLLTRGIDVNGNIRSKDTHKFTVKNGIEVPDEWEVKPLGELGSWLSGGTPSKNVPSFWNGNLPWVSAKDLKQFYLTEYKDFLTVDGAKRGTRVVPRDTILLVVRGMILAHTFPVSLTTTETAFNQDLRACICNRDVLPHYLAYWLLANGPALLGLTTAATHGTRRFDSEELLNYFVGFPSEKAEQERIVETVEKVDERINRDQKYLTKLFAIKKGLMQDLLTGRKRVKVDA